MTIGRDYMLAKPAKPSGSTFFFHAKVVPLAVNTAGGAEVALDRLATRSGLRPSLILAGLIGLAGLALFSLFRSPKA